jgi:hypothetical protein
MKTIIARFQELKKPMDEIGEVEGEIVDANKIETALRSAGVALRDASGQFRNFDEVILELANKWDTLDLMTQRYIATQAAGSRQQSRFLALMADNERLTELVTAANNAQGSANRQYEKTLDSLEAKVNQLNNALDIFWTNLANNDVIKGAIDLITNFINILNNITGTFTNSENSIISFAGSLGQLLLVFAGFKGAQKLINVFFSSIGKSFLSPSISKDAKKGGEQAGTSFANGMASKLRTFVNGSKSIFSNMSSDLSKQLQGIFKEKGGATTGSLSSFLGDLSDDKLKSIDLSGMATNLKNDFAKNFKDLGITVNEEVQASLNTFVKDFSEGNFDKAFTGINKKYKELAEKNGTFTTESAAQFNTFSMSVNKVTAALNKTGIAFEGIAAVGATVSGILSSVASSLRAQGMDEQADQIDNVANALSVVSVAFGVLGTAAMLAGQAAQAGWGPLLPVLLAIAVVIGLVTFGVQALSDWIVTTQEKIDSLKDVSEQLNSELSEAKSNLDDLTSSKTDLDTLNEELDNLAVGTQEWRDKLVEVNQQVLDLINKYPQLAQYLETGQDGQMQLNAEGYDEFLASQQARINANQTAQMGVNMLLTSYEGAQSISNYRYANDITSEEMQNARIQLDTITLGLAELSSNLAKDWGLAENTTYETMNMLVSQGQSGVNSEDFTKIISTMADRGITTVEDKNIGAIREIYDAVTDGTEEQFNAFIAELQNGGENLSEIIVQTQESLQLMESQRDTMIANILSQNETLTEPGNEQLKDAISGILDTTQDTMSQDIEAEKEEVASLDLEARKKEYAGIMEMTVDEVSAKIADSSLSEETINQTIAINRVSDTIAEKADEIVGVLSGLDLSGANGTALLNAVTNEGLNLTQGDISTILNGAGFNISGTPSEANINALDEEYINNYLDTIQEGLTLTDLKMTADQFKQNLLNAQETIENAFNESDKLGSKPYQFGATIRNLVTDLDESVGGLSAEQMEGFADTMKDITIRGGDVELFSASLKGIIDSANPDDIEEIVGLLSSTDWSSEEQIESTMSAIEDLGYTFDNNLIPQILEATKAAAEFSLEKIEEELSSLNSAIEVVEDKAESGETAYTKEEYDQLVAAGANESDFIRTGIDEFIYTGEDTNTLLTELNGLASQILDNQARDLDKQVEEGAKYERLDSEEFKTIQDIINGSIKISPTVTGESTISHRDAFDLAENLGLVDPAEYSKLSLEGLQARIAQDFNQYYGTNGSAYQQSLSQQESFNSQYNSLINSGTSHGPLLNIDSSTYDYDYSARGLKLNEEQQLAQARSDIQASGYDVNSIDALASSIQKVNTGLSEAQALRMALANANTSSGLSEIISSYEEWNALIDENTGLISASTYEDAEAFAALKKSVNKMLNTSQDLSDAFWDNSENIKNLQEAAQGSEEALHALQKAAGEDYLLNLDLSHLGGEALDDAKEAINDFLDYYNSIEIPTIEPNVDMYKVWDGAQQFTDAFNQMAAQANLSAEQIQAAAQSMGFDAEITYQEDTRKLPMYEQTETITKNSKGERVVRTGTPVIYDWADVTGYFPVVKTFTPSGTGGGNISVSNMSSSTPSSGSGGSGSSGGGGGSSSEEKEEEPWVADYDWLYNLVEKTNEELRKRNKLENEYEKILRKEGIQLSDALKNRQDQLKTLQNARGLYQQQLAGRQTEATRIENEYSDVGRYANYNETLGYVEIDWNAIEALSGQTGNNETGERIDEYISKLEDISGKIDDAEDQLIDIEDQIYELERQGMDDLASLEDQVINAIEKMRQDEIDNLTELNESINEANTKMLDKISTGIDDYRNQRQSDEDLTNIEEMERRLALMQSDTSGANALDILNLRDQIDEARQNYTDSLIDKSIDQMTRQNEQAYEQRQYQIDLMQAQLDWDIESGKLAQQANSMITEAIRTSPNSLINLLKATDLYKGMGTVTQQQWSEDLNQAIENGFSFWINNNSLTGTTSGAAALRKSMQGKTITFTDKTGTQRKGTVQSNGSVKVGNTLYTDVTQGTDGSWFQAATGSTSTQSTKPKPSSSSSSSNKTVKIGGLINAGSAKIYRSSYGDGPSQQYFGSDPIYTVIGENNGYYLVRHRSVSSGYTGWFKKGDVKAYQTGGLADYTGLAWLDGTKTNPELILNAKDTQNFIELKDILRDTFNSNNNTNNSTKIGGDNYYNINIDVGEIGNDYDVEQMMNKMKEIIVQDSMYRNVNAVELGRR